MLQLVGSKSKFCDGISRRSFLNVGSLALGGLSLPQLLKADELSGNKTRHKSVIMIFLPGGSSHLDIWDLKPDAPIEIRGEFQPIQSSIPGFPICEHLPKFAQNLDRFTIIRSLVGAKNEHASELCLSGFDYQDSKIRNQPSLGSAISYLQGPVDRGMPPFVSMVYHTNNLWRDPGRAGFVGSAHKPFQPNDEGKADMVLQMSRNRLNDRRQLLQSVDRLKRAVEVSDVMQSVDSYTSQALHMLTSNRLLEALDISKESPETLARYGQGNRDAVDDGSPMNNEDFLIARRLVEAGARCVSVSFGRWDTHSCRKAGDLAYKNNFAQLKEYLPRLEQCLLALTQDLQERGLEDDVAVVVWGKWDARHESMPMEGEITGLRYLAVYLPVADLIMGRYSDLQPVWLKKPKIGQSTTKMSLPRSTNIWASMSPKSKSQTSTDDHSIYCNTVKAFLN